MLYCVVIIRESGVIMLRKTSPPREESEFVPQTPAPAATKASAGRTVIGEFISIEGDIRGDEDLLIEGSVKGSISLQSHHLTVGPKGKVEAEIDAENVTISGTLTGNIQATGKVAITKDADFTGEIKAKRISVEDGAFLKAVVELERETKKQPTPLTKPVDSSSSSPGLGVAGEAGKAS